MNALLNRKLIALRTSNIKLERAYTSHLSHLKALEQKEAYIAKRSRWLEIIKLKAEINKIGTKRTNYRQNQQNQELVLGENQQNR